MSKPCHIPTSIKNFQGTMTSYNDHNKKRYWPHSNQYGEWNIAILRRLDEFHENTGTWLNTPGHNNNKDMKTTEKIKQKFLTGKIYQTK
jgi:hypothetical protein